MTRARRLRLAGLAGGLLAVALGAAPAAAAARGGGSVRAPSPPGQVSIVITSLSPSYARPGGQITVRGVVDNLTDATSPGNLLVRIWSSTIPLTTPAQLKTYLQSSGTSLDSPVQGVQATAPSPLPPHHSASWSVTLPVSQLGMHSFGAYPFAAELTSGGAPVAVARTFLPFWPGGAHANRMSIAWVWPLMDTSPQRTACPALLSNDLAASVAGQGRLGQLLEAGMSADGRAADLTWAVDPALIGDVQVMTKPYQVMTNPYRVDGSGVTCADAKSHPASAAAAAWLARVRSMAAHDDFFATPYNDPDIAALSKAGQWPQLGTDFQQGRVVAQSLLGVAQRTGTGGASGTRATGQGLTGQMGWVAWPPDGIADYPALENLTADQISTVILNSTAMQPVGGATLAPGAVTTTPVGGSQVRVLLADNDLSSIASLSAGHIPGAVSYAAPTQPLPRSVVRSSQVLSQAAAFTQQQWFLAETAMMAAQTPAIRSVVVAPVRRWDPSPAAASGLLKETVATPWLHPVSLASLAATRPLNRKYFTQPSTGSASPSQLRASVMRKAAELSRLAGLQGTITQQPDYLSTALAAVESSAWRGRPAQQRRASRLARWLIAYVSAQLSQVRLIQSQQVTLAGKSGFVPVTIHNGQSSPVAVQLHVSVPNGDLVKVGQLPNDGTVQVPGGARVTMKVPIQKAPAGTTTLTAWLTAPNGNERVGSGTTVTVEATQFGTLAVEVIGVALLLFVATAAFRAIRRGARTGPVAAPADGPEDDEVNPASQVAQTDTVEAEQTENAHPSKGSHDHASTPGRTGQAGPARRG